MNAPAAIKPRNAEEAAELRTLFGFLALSQVERARYCARLSVESLAGLLNSLEDIAGALKGTPQGRVRIAQKSGPGPADGVEMVPIGESVNSAAVTARTVLTRRTATNSSLSQPYGPNGSGYTDAYGKGTLNGYAGIADDPGRVGLGSWLSRAFRQVTGVRLSEAIAPIAGIAGSVIGGPIGGVVASAASSIFSGTSAQQQQSQWNEARSRAEAWAAQNPAATVEQVERRRRVAAEADAARSTPSTQMDLAVWTEAARIVAARAPEPSSSTGFPIGLALAAGALLLLAA